MERFAHDYNAVSGKKDKRGGVIRGCYTLICPATPPPSRPELSLTLSMNRKERVAENVVADGCSKDSAVHDGGSKVHPAKNARVSDLIQRCRNWESSVSLRALGQKL